MEATKYGGPIYNFKLQYSFLSFVKDNHINKIAYAASFGVDCWEYSDSQTKMCSKLAKDFDAISVREYSAIALCKNYLNVDAIRCSRPDTVVGKGAIYVIVQRNSKAIILVFGCICFGYDR